MASTVSRLLDWADSDTVPATIAKQNAARFNTFPITDRLALAPGPDACKPDIVVLWLT